MVEGILALVLSAADVEPTDSVCEGCQPVEAYINAVDRQIAATGKAVGDRIAPCTILKSQEFRDGVLHQEVEWLATEKCVKMDAPKRWRGLWRNEFEGSQFCPGTPDHCSYDDQPRIWFAKGKAKFPNGVKPSIGYIYEIEFVGRMTAYKGQYGHFGLFDHEVVADEVISIRQLPTKD